MCIRDRVKINPANFDVLDVILQTLFSFESAIEQKRVDIEGLDRDKVIVEADKDLIHQVVYNLIENAVKFVNQGGTLDVYKRQVLTTESLVTDHPAENPAPDAPAGGMGGMY